MVSYNATELFYWDSPTFFLIKHLPGSWKLLIHFQTSYKVNFDIFPIDMLFFLEVWALGSVYLIIFTDMPLYVFFNSSLDSVPFITHFLKKEKNTW